MGATLRLDRFQLLWLCEGFVGKSHLRWDGYDLMVNEVWPQLSNNEREAIYTYVKRDLSWHFKSEFSKDSTDAEYFQQMLARFNPSNQYKVTMKDGRKYVVAEDAYLYKEKYYVSWQRYCEPKAIKKVEHKPYKKCSNTFCSSKENCLRFRSLEEKETTREGLMLDNLFACDKCDLIIETKTDEKKNR